MAKLGGRIKSAKILVLGAGSVVVELGDGEAEDWTKVASDVLHLIAHTDEYWLIYVDELPIMRWPCSILAECRTSVSVAPWAP